MSIERAQVIFYVTNIINVCLAFFHVKSEQHIFRHIFGRGPGIDIKAKILARANPG